MDQFFTILSSTVSAFVALTATLLGVWFTSKGTTERLRMQLEHDLELKSKERIFGVRKDVYLKVLEETGRASSYLSSLPQIDPITTNIGAGVQEFNAVIAKMQLIADPAAAMCAGRYQGEFTLLSMRMMAEAAPLHSVNREIKLLSGFYEDCLANSKRAQQEMSLLVESGHIDEVRFNSLRISIDSFQKLAMEYHEKRDVCFKQQATSLLEYYSSLLKEMTALHPHTVELSMHLRRGLDQQVDETVMKELADKNFASVVQGLNRYIEDMASKKTTNEQPSA